MDLNNLNMKKFDLTELGNAERFADRFSETVRYVSEWRKWINWDDKRWKLTSNESVRKLAHSVAKDFYSFASQEKNPDSASKLAKWAINSSRSSAITAMLKEASSLLAISAESLDTDPWLFNTNNCTINLKSGKIQQHNREDLITKMTFPH
jgi:putative DNA primase/helicase